MNARRKIQRMSEQASDKLCAAQVIPDLPSIIKELVDNSIDAKATVIKIVLNDFGKNKLEVIDNGCGIALENLKRIAEQGATSKLGQFDQINNVSSLGFRGQALCSIASIGQLVIQSMHADDNKGYSIDFTNRTLSEVSTHYGTKIVLSNPFHTIPVRRQYLSTKTIQISNEIQELLKQYSLIYVDIQFVLQNSVGGKNDCYFDSGIGSLFGQTAWKKRLQCVLGSRIADALQYIKSDTYQGWIMSRILSGSMKPQQWLKKKITYMYCNKRPINFLQSFKSVLQQIYKQYNSSSKYVCILNLKFKQNQFDINITPDKRQIYWTNQRDAVKQFKSTLQKMTQKSRNEIKNLSIYIQKKSISKRQSTSNPSNQRDLLKTKVSSNIKQRLNLAMNIGSKNVNKTQPSINKNEQINTLKMIQQEPIENKDKDKDKDNDSQLKQNDIGIINRVNTSISNEDTKVNIKIEDVSANIDKQDFGKMKIIGQFNCGFIVAQLDDKFFLIDQHAADQKTNYQKMLKSKWDFMLTNTTLKLTPDQHDRLIESNKMENFGYKYEVFSNQQGRYQVAIYQMPVYFGETFKQDFFLDILDSDIQSFAKHPIFQKKVATYACRKSIMIGDFLQKQQMKKVVYGLTSLQSPWNCPHGRPTSILLNSVGYFLNNVKQQKKYTL